MQTDIDCVQMDPTAIAEGSLEAKIVNKNDRARLNISGIKFEVRYSTLLKFPHSRLGRLASAVCQNAKDSVCIVLS